MISQHDLVPVVDFGAQYAQFIARRVRDAHVYSEIIGSETSVKEILTRRSSAIILSGGPSLVYADDAPQVDPTLFKAGIPVFGICYGFQATAQTLGGSVTKIGQRECGRTSLPIQNSGKLLAVLPNTLNVWVNHGDSVFRAPEGFHVLVRMAGVPAAALECRMRKLAEVQWYPEVVHTQWGQQVLEHFLLYIAGLAPDWTPENMVSEATADIRAQVGDSWVLYALSGGVDFAVAAALVQRAVGPQLIYVLVGHSLLREGEAKQVKKGFIEITGVDLIVVNRSERFLGALEGVSGPEEKHKIIGREFIRAFEAMVARLAGERGIDFLMQGTLYPDMVESGGGVGTTNIKSYHNVGDLPEDLQSTLIELSRTMFKDEARAVGLQLGLPDSPMWRHPLPGLGLGIRIIDEVTAEWSAVLRRADAVVRRELANARKEWEIWQFPVVLLMDVRSAGVQGGGRTYGHPIVLRLVTSDDTMTVDWAKLPWELPEKIFIWITNECTKVSRVVLDITSRPLATIEWEQLWDETLHNALMLKRIPRQANPGSLGAWIASVTRDS